MKKTIKIFAVKFRGGDTVEVTAKNRTEAVKAAKTESNGRAIIGWEDVTEDRIAMYREELYNVCNLPDCLSPGAGNYLAALLDQTAGG